MASHLVLGNIELDQIAGLVSRNRRAIVYVVLQQAIDLGGMARRQSRLKYKVNLAGGRQQLKCLWLRQQRPVRLWIEQWECATRRLGQALIHVGDTTEETIS